MQETIKSLPSLIRNGDMDLLRGRILDVGCGPCPIPLPVPSVVDGWDLEQGDAQCLEGVKDGSYDAVFGSHIAEHVVHFPTALNNWSRVVREGGAVILLVPDVVLYEHLEWPSRFNADHKSSFSIWDFPWEFSQPLYTYKDMVKHGREAGLTLTDVRLTCDGYDLSQILNKNFDQTMHGALAQITWVYQKI